MKLSQLVERLCSKIPISVKLPSDIEIEKPEDLMSLEIHHLIGDAVTEACLDSGLTYRGAYAFGEWLAGLVTGWATRYSNELDVMYLEKAFGLGAFNDAASSVRLYLLPSWSYLDELVEDIAEGVKEAYSEAVKFRS